MNRMTLVVMLLGFSVRPALAERPMLRGREAPRATDLLRAEKLAEQAEKRLKVPPRHGGGWKKGGHGWDARGEAAAEGPEPVIINVRPQNRRARTQ
jgi:hypothetical protein